MAGLRLGPPIEPAEVTIRHRLRAREIDSNPIMKRWPSI
jgi:hypothetical protein